MTRSDPSNDRAELGFWLGSAFHGLGYATEAVRGVLPLAIIKRVTELSGGQLQWTDGMLYPVLHRLERHGLVAATWGESDSGRSRK